jgi:hypothetical protein
MAADIDIVIGAQDKASAVINSVASGVTSMGGSLAKLGPAALGIGAAIGGAVAALVAFKVAASAVGEAASQIDEVAKSARGMGESVGDLQAFQFAMGEIGGLDPGQAAAALQKTQEAVGKALSGDKGKIDIFAKLGVDANALSLQGPVEQFNTIRTALGDIENVSERAAAAQQVFGKSAKDLLPVLLANTAEFDESMKAADALGQTVTGQGAAGIEAMNDAVGRVKAGFSGLAMQAASAVAPLIESIATSIAEWIPPVITLAKEILPTIVDYVATFLGHTIDLGKAWMALNTLNFSGLKSVISDMANGTGTAAALTAKLADSRQRATEKAIAEEERLQAIQAASMAMEEESVAVEEAKASAADKTVESLERKLAVLQMGEAAVRRQEELATAVNDVERERIETLQKQIDMQEESVRLAKEKADQDKELQKQQEKAAADALKEASDKADKLSQFTAGTQASESRLLTRGPETKGIDKIAKESEKSNTLLGQIKTALEQTGLTSSGPQLEFVY